MLTFVENRYWKCGAAMIQCEKISIKLFFFKAGNSSVKQYTQKHKCTQSDDVIMMHKNMCSI